jgi:ABC-type polysaccharide/polyol phosphate export permease
MQLIESLRIAVYMTRFVEWLIVLMIYLYQVKQRYYKKQDHFFATCALGYILINTIIATIAVDTKSIRYNMDITRLKLSHKYPVTTRYMCVTQSIYNFFSNTLDLKISYVYLCCSNKIGADKKMTINVFT